MTAPDGPTELRALAHPLRLRILSLLTGTAMSAAEVARELGTTQANASYHLRRLHDAGLLVVAEEVPIRGGVAKRYRHDQESGDRSRSQGPQDEQLLAAVLGEELRRRSALREKGTGGALADAELWVEPEVWDDVRATVHEAMTRLHAAARPPRTPGTVRTSTTLSMFRMVQDEETGR